LQNNILYQLNSAAPYLDNHNALPDGIHGANNLMYGIGTAPASDYVISTINSNPGFVNPSVDFHLASANSPANGAGSKSSPVAAADHDGVPRSSSPAVGAYEYREIPIENGANPPDNHVRKDRDST
jgi:hypothetical protein